MEHQQILTKAIQRAIDNRWGWQLNEEVQDYSGDKCLILKMPEGSFYRVSINNPYELLFYLGFGFAKTLWGEDWGSDEKLVLSALYASDPTPWKYHLQQMVIAEDPISYLGEHL